MPYPAGNVLIPASHGKLEGILKAPGDRQARGVALVLHPLPTGGGTMHNKVVFRAAVALNDAGMISLRINFRGVGQSTGEFDSGRGELEDARTALDYLEAQYPGQTLTLCGFSFGAQVGMQLGIADARVKYLISVGTPVDKYDFGFLAACRKPILFVQGERDEFGDVNRLRALVDKLAEHADAQLVVIPEADHFFVNRLDALKRAILEWMSGKLTASSL